MISFPAAFPFSFYLPFASFLAVRYCMMMRLLILEVSVQLAVFVAIGSSSGTVYITDLPIYSVLGQCSCREALRSMARSMYHCFWYKLPAIYYAIEFIV